MIFSPQEYCDITWVYGEDQKEKKKVFIPELLHFEMASEEFSCV